MHENSKQAWTSSKDKHKRFRTFQFGEKTISIPRNKKVCTIPLKMFSTDAR